MLVQHNFDWTAIGVITDTDKRERVDNLIARHFDAIIIPNAYFTVAKCSIYIALSRQKFDHN